MFFPSPVDQGKIKISPEDLPQVPKLSLSIPFTSVVYGSNSMHLTYTLQVQDDTTDLVWQCPHRYSTYRNLHNTIGKHYVPSSQFPGFLLTQRSNRNKCNIEERRKGLEKYLVKLLQVIFAPFTLSGSKASSDSPNFSRLVKLLRFLEFPHVEEWEAVLERYDGEDQGTTTTGSSEKDLLTNSQNGKPGLVRSSSWSSPPGSGILRAASEGGAGKRSMSSTQSVASSISTLWSSASSSSTIGKENTTNLSAQLVLIVTRWVAPEMKPGENLGLVLPFASLSMGVSGMWGVSIRAEKQARKGLLRHRYDEIVALSEEMCNKTHILDLKAMQEFIVEFRAKHPLHCYLRFEQTLMSTRSERSSVMDRSDYQSDNDMASSASASSENGIGNRWGGMGGYRYNSKVVGADNNAMEFSGVKGGGENNAFGSPIRQRGPLDEEDEEDEEENVKRRRQTLNEEEAPLFVSSSRIQSLVNNNMDVVDQHKAQRTFLTSNSYHYSLVKPVATSSELQDWIYPSKEKIRKQRKEEKERQMKEAGKEFIHHQEAQKEGNGDGVDFEVEEEEEENYTNASSACVSKEEGEFSKKCSEMFIKNNTKKSKNEGGSKDKKEGVSPSSSLAQQNRIQPEENDHIMAVVVENGSKEEGSKKEKGTDRCRVDSGVDALERQLDLQPTMSINSATPERSNEEGPLDGEEGEEGEEGEKKDEKENILKYGNNTPQKGAAGGNDQDREQQQKKATNILLSMVGKNSTKRRIQEEGAQQSKSNSQTKTGDNDDRDKESVEDRNKKKLAVDKNQLLEARHHKYKSKIKPEERIEEYIAARKGPLLNACHCDPDKFCVAHTPLPPPSAINLPSVATWTMNRYGTSNPAVVASMGSTQTDHEGAEELLEEEGNRLVSGGGDSSSLANTTTTGSSMFQMRCGITMFVCPPPMDQKCNCTGETQ